MVADPWSFGCGPGWRDRQGHLLHRELVSNAGLLHPAADVGRGVHSPRCVLTSKTGVAVEPAGGADPRITPSSREQGEAARWSSAALIKRRPVPTSVSRTYTPPWKHTVPHHSERRWIRRSSRCPTACPLCGSCDVAATAGRRRSPASSTSPSVARAGLGDGVRHFFYGGAPGVAQEAARRLTALVPGVQVVGTLTPPFTGISTWPVDDLKEALQQREARHPVGGPRSSEARTLDVHDGGGGAGRPREASGSGRDRLLGGAKVPAPSILRHVGLEWLFRLAMEPRRLWRRYLLGNSTFV